MEARLNYLKLSTQINDSYIIVLYRIHKHWSTKNIVLVLCKKVRYRLGQRRPFCFKTFAFQQKYIFFLLFINKMESYLKWNTTKNYAYEMKKFIVHQIDISQWVSLCISSISVHVYCFWGQFIPIFGLPW